MRLGTFRALLFEDVLVVAREGSDLEPLFLALTRQDGLRRGHVRGAGGGVAGAAHGFSKLAKQTDEFVQRLGGTGPAGRGGGGDSRQAIPGLSAEGAGSLAGEWMPGSLLELSAWTSLCPALGGLPAVWLPLARRAEGGICSTGPRRVAPGWLHARAGGGRHRSRGRG